MLHGASVRVRCAACGEEHPVKPDLARAAEAYREARANLPLQLTQAGRIDALLAESRVIFDRFRRGAAVLSAPLLVLFLVGLRLMTLWQEDAYRGYALYAPPLLLPLSVFLIMSVIAWRLLARRRAVVESLLWARPMKDVPGTFACRMCGGQLAAETANNAVIKCRYCQTDNMLGPAVSRAAAAHVLDDYVAHATAVLARVSGPNARWGRWLARSVIVTPLLVLVVLLFGARLLRGRLEAERLPPDEAISYVKVHWPREAAACIHRADVDPAQAWNGAASRRSDSPIFEARSFSVGAFVGQGAFEFPQNIDDLRVTGLFRDGLGRNHVLVSAPFGVGGESLVTGLCIAEPTAPAAH